MLQQSLLHKSFMKSSSVFCAQNTKCPTDRPLMEDSEGPVDVRALTQCLEDPSHLYPGIRALLKCCGGPLCEARHHKSQLPPSAYLPIGQSLDAEVHD